MASTIQQVGTLSAFERRERRKQKILNNVDARLNRLLTAQGEAQSAPCVDDLSSKPSVESNDSALGLDDTQTSSVLDDSGVEDLNKSKIEYVEPEYFEMIDRNRIFVSMMLGAIFFLLHQYEIMDNLVIPLLLLLLSFEAFQFRSRKSKYPKHGYIVNTLMAAGINESIVINTGIMVDIAFDMCCDLLVVAMMFQNSRLVHNVFSHILDLLFPGNPVPSKAN